MSKPYNFRTKTRKTNVIINVFPSKTVLPSNKHMANDPAQTHIRKESSKQIIQDHPSTLPQKRAQTCQKTSVFSGDNPKRFSDPIKFESSVSGANSLDP